MFFLVAPMHVLGGFPTREAAKAEANRRKDDPRKDFFAIISAQNENEARAKAKKFYEELERMTGQAWKN